MTNEDLIAEIATEVRAKMEGEGSGHDWWHVYRVWKSAERIGLEEKADMLVVNLGALLHDIADWKFNDGDDEAGSRTSRAMLESRGVSEEVIKAVSTVVGQVSYYGAGVDTTPSTLEGKVVQDADRLDALGAIGIARTFAYGGHKNRAMYDPEIKPVIHATKEEYKKSQSPTLNHFYEKLFLLKDLVNTASAKKMAVERHEYMKEYVDRFLKEWEGQL